MRKILIGSLVVAGLAVGSFAVVALDPVGAATAAGTHHGPAEARGTAQKHAMKKAQKFDGHEHRANGSK